MKLSTTINLSTDLPQLVTQLTSLLRDISYQVNGLTEGSVTVVHSAYTSAPTTGTYKQGDFIRHSGPSGASPALGFLCTASGSPGTWVEFLIGAGSGGVASDAIWDAKGDPAGGTGSNTAVKLTVGANNTVLSAASGETTGLKWNTLTTLGAELAANKNAASGYAGLSAASRTTKGVDTTDDLIVDLATKGLVLKDTQGTPHYWRVTIDNAGALVTADLGTSKP